LSTSLNEIPLPRLPQIPEGTGVIKSDLSQIWIVPVFELPNCTSALQCGFIKLSVASNALRTLSDI